MELPCPILKGRSILISFQTTTWMAQIVLVNNEDENNIKGGDRTTTWKEAEYLEDFMEESSPTSLELSTSRLLSVTFIFIVVAKLVL